MENYQSMMKLVHEFHIEHVPQALRYIKLGKTDEECRDLAEDWANNEKIGKINSETSYGDLKKNLNIGKSRSIDHGYSGKHDDDVIKGAGEEYTQEIDARLTENSKNIEASKAKFLRDIIE